MEAKTNAQLVQNPFEKLPLELISTILSPIPTVFGEIPALSLVSKKFAEATGCSMETICKRLSLQWWDNNEEIQEAMVLGPNEQNIHLLILAQEKAYQINSRFDWVWFGKCIQKFEPLDWNLQGECLMFGELQEVVDNEGNIRIKYPSLFWGFGITFSFDAGLVEGGEYQVEILNGEGFNYDLSLLHYYTGQFKEGIPDGRGCFKRENGISVSGNFINGEIEGNALVTWPDRIQMSAEFKGGKPVEEGKMIHPALTRKIENQLCTAAKEKADICQAQMAYFCHECRFGIYCVTCWERCHEDLDHTGSRTWYPHVMCCCEERGCISRTDRHNKKPRLH